MMRISPLLKGLITAAVMTGIILLIYAKGKNADLRLQYLVYICYALGITWSIMAYRFSDKYSGRFGDAFNQGFRCFIVVIFIMAVFYLVFTSTHPEFADESAQAYREHLIKENKKIGQDLEDDVSTYKKQYTLKLVSGSIFGYLIIGAGVSAVASALVYRRK
jgi:uncharacterized membrane protein YfcA